jgi:hypothetical protein
MNPSDSVRARLAVVLRNRPPGIRRRPRLAPTLLALEGRALLSGSSQTVATLTTRGFQFQTAGGWAYADDENPSGVDYNGGQLL